MVLRMSPTSLRAAVVVQTLLLSPDQVNNHQEAVKATLHSLEGMLWVNSWRLGLLLAILELKKEDHQCKPPETEQHVAELSRTQQISATATTKRWP